MTYTGKIFTSSISNPINAFGFDLEVGTMQMYFSQLGFIEKIFGNTVIQKRVKSEEDSLTSFNEGNRGTSRYDTWYPQGFSFGEDGGSIDQDLTFDDSYASRIFFLLREDNNVNMKISNWDWTDSLIQVQQPFSIIFHCNLDSLEFRSSEFIKASLLAALGKCPKIVAHKTFETIENVWKEYTITPEMTGVTRYPNYCLRIDAICTYVPFDYNIPL